MKKHIIFLICGVVLILIAFYQVVLNLSTHLIDWFDYPYLIWVMHQNIQKLITLDFIHFFDTNAFYPFRLTLLFSDTLLPQSVIALPFSLITHNPIFAFNITFILTFILNYLSSYFFWNTLFKKPHLAFFGALLTVFSPFFHIQLNHFQMVNYWPFFLCLSYFYQHHNKMYVKQMIIVGILLAIQFLASVYLAIFLIATLILFALSDMILNQDKTRIIKYLSVIFGVFVLLDGVFIKGYMDMKKLYQIKRPINEYIMYSAHPTDYLFTVGMRSILNTNPLVEKWNTANKHAIGERAVNPGMLLTVLSLFGLVFLIKKKNIVSVGLELDRDSLFFLTLIAVGFCFSLGPRLSFNGTYAHIPTPYTLFLKIVPLLDSVRAVARWSILFYTGLTYFTLLTLSKINPKKFNWFIPIVVIFFIVEYFPINITATKEMYLTKDNRVLQKICSQDKRVLLEIPVTHLNVAGGIAEGLKYITTIELNSLLHKCYLINGYSGYDIPELQTLESTLNSQIENNDMDNFIETLKKHKADYVKFNWDKLKIKNTAPFIYNLPTSSLSIVEGDLYRVR